MFLQFLPVLNLFLGGKREISKNALTEVYQNQLVQIVNKREARTELEFDAIENLMAEINLLFQNVIFSNKCYRQ